MTHAPEEWLSADRTVTVVTKKCLEQYFKMLARSTEARFCAAADAWVRIEQISQQCGTRPRCRQNKHWLGYS
jgi:hypothetical protein